MRIYTEQSVLASRGAYRTSKHKPLHLGTNTAVADGRGHGASRELSGNSVRDVLFGATKLFVSWNRLPIFFRVRAVPVVNLVRVQRNDHEVNEGYVVFHVRSLGHSRVKGLDVLVCIIGSSFHAEAFPRRARIPHSPSRHHRRVRGGQNAHRENVPDRQPPLRVEVRGNRGVNVPTVCPYVVFFFPITRVPKPITTQRAHWGDCYAFRDWRWRCAPRHAHENV
mmetsp:Transcript_1540/g.5787  ORF Transcript_1540/g.5787 Transcript_1540/m.5787 type:complete len:223 (+) Transcript_1540:2182-2850(+)